MIFTMMTIQRYDLQILLKTIIRLQKFQNNYHLLPNIRPISQYKLAAIYAKSLYMDISNSTDIRLQVTEAY